MKQEIQELLQEKICDYCETYIIEGSSCSSTYVCEGSHCEDATNKYEDDMDKILVLDIETTGFLKEGGSIVEIGIVELNVETGETKIIFDSLCRERILTARHREEPFGWIFRNSDLTVEEVRNAPDFDDIKAQVQAIISSYPLGATAFNKPFDFDFLKDRGLKFPKELGCLMRLSTPICKLPNQNGYGSYKWPTAEEAFNHFFPEIEYTEKHRGADDAEHEAMIAAKLYGMDILKV